MKKGFTYIITTMILILLITGILVINKPTKLPKVSTQQFLSKNYQIEFSKLCAKSNIDENTIDAFNTVFLNYISSYNYDVKMCNIIEKETSIYLSNYTGEPCDLVVDGVVLQTINDKTTKKIDRFINNMNIYLCNCEYKTGRNIYYINIYNNNVRTIYKN